MRPFAGRLKNSYAGEHSRKMLRIFRSIHSEKSVHRAGADRASPNITMAHRKVDEKPGVKGMLPLGCLPLWGREGVTLIVAE